MIRITLNYTPALLVGWFCLGSIAFGYQESRESQTRVSTTPSRASLIEKGAEIFSAQCVDCHGKGGQGAEAYPSPLEGDLSLKQLGHLIQTTMPEQDPGSLTDQEASDVALFIHDSFYSSIARERNRPARIELLRLTVEQYRQAAADLVGGGDGPEAVDDRRGLEAVYVASRNPFDRKAVKKERLDPQVDFDFGIEPPVSEIEDPRRFSMVWKGSVYAPETGKYTIAVGSQHSVRIKLNSREPLIDAWVKSDDENHFAAEVYLLGGRYYPIVVEFSKSKQGVDDSAKQKKLPPVKPASIVLQWRRPHGKLETIASRYLTPTVARIKYVCTTPFPPDDQSYGWVRANSISKEWDRATTLAAFEAAAFVVKAADQLAKTRADDPQRREKLKSYCHRFVERAFRVPLGADDPIRRFVDQQFDGEKELVSAVRRVVLFALKSPRFLYRELDIDNEPYQVAARLSFGLWNSMPDGVLLKAAAEGQLETREQVAAQAARMVTDDRAQHKLMDFFRSWLQIDAEHDLNKDLDRYPGFDERTMSDLRSSLELMLADLIVSEQADFRQLVCGDEVYLNQSLVDLFELDEMVGDDFKLLKFEPDRRAGVLTHPYLLAQFSYPDESSPIHRGVFIARNLLGKSLRPPPEAFAPFAPELHEGLTTRERVALQTKSAECMSCHQVINPLGFALENFDAVGRFRETENNKSVDAKVEFDFGDSKTVAIESANELAERVLNDQTAQAAFCERLFQYLVGQPILAYGPEAKMKLREFFVEHEFNIKLLAEEIMKISALEGRSSQ